MLKVVVSKVTDISHSLVLASTKICTIGKATFKSRGKCMRALFLKVDESSLILFDPLRPRRNLLLFVAEPPTLFEL